MKGYRLELAPMLARQTGAQIAAYRLAQPKETNMRRFIGALIAAAAFAGAAQSDTLDLAGLWLTQARTARVQVNDCGDGTPCGVVRWVDPAAAGAGKDARNPDPALRERPLVGLTLFSGFNKDGARWRGGRIFDPESGRTYSSRLELQRDGTLHVVGCFGPICRTQRWTRAE
jgi:uncharacterized protein (DUF2147 family)